MESHRMQIIACFHLIAKGSEALVTDFLQTAANRSEIFWQAVLKRYLIYGGGKFIKWRKRRTLFEHDGSSIILTIQKSCTSKSG